MSGFCIDCGCSGADDEARCPACLSRDASRHGATVVVDLDDASSPRARTSSPWAALLILCVVALGASVLVPNMIRAHARGHATACKSNLKNIGTALEMYSTDNRGLFPDKLSRLVPNYLRQVPICPGAAVDSYSPTYTVANKHKHQGYTVICTGLNHSGVGYSENYPQYTSTQGLLER